jgi:hypothetical protein
VQPGTNCTALPLEHDVPAIDVLAFPPDEIELERLRRIDELRSDELERRSRIALFISVGMFAAWAADVGAVFAHGQGPASAVYGMLSVPLAVIIVVSLLYGRWALARSEQARQALKLHAAVRAVDSASLLELAARSPVVAQYLRLVGRQQRPLREFERLALETWAAEGERQVRFER